jgi:hypothetical protein
LFKSLEAKIAMHPVYEFERACLEPYTLKYLNATVGIHRESGYVASEVRTKIGV